MDGGQAEGPIGRHQRRSKASLTPGSTCAANRAARPFEAHATVRWDDVVVDAANDAVRFRREMEAAFRG